MNRTDIPRVSVLWLDYQVLNKALEAINSQPRITAFTVAGAPDPQGDPTIIETVSAEGIVYPPLMIDAIRTQVQARLNQINTELATLGVT